MSEVIINEVRHGFYVDSVALMRLSQTIAQLDGVQEAALMMGTPANQEILAAARLLSEAGEAAQGGDLVIAVRAGDADSAERARAAAIEALNQAGGATGDGEAWRPKTARAAIAALPDANLALISVPGDFAIAEARKAIRRGLNAMIFSDNVALDDEVALKREARDLGCLVMGPDCGTAIINGVPLAFANQVRRGDIGIVGASGTGLQEVTCLVDQAGGGISHAIGVGGRDLSRDVGGISTLMALDLLDGDAATKHLVLISKPPPADIAARILERVGQSSKPATVCFIGAETMAMPENAEQVTTLRDAAARAAGGGVAANEVAPALATAPGRTELRGLYSGGTLCGEAQVVLRAAGVTVGSNAPIPGVAAADEMAEGHTLVDLGDDRFTQGRPHPMIDPSVRDAPLRAALASPGTAVVLLDVVIGYGAHGDPAGHLAALLAENPKAERPTIIASVTGTDADPQNRAGQVAKLTATGVHVAPDNATAAAWAVAALPS